MYIVSIWESELLVLILCLPHTENHQLNWKFCWNHKLSQISSIVLVLLKINSSVQLLSHVWLFAIPWTVACQLHYPSPALRVCSNSCLLSQWWHPTISSSIVPFSSCLSFFLLSISSSIKVFSNESALRIRWPKYWSFSISPFNEYSGLTSFRIDWFDLLAVQGLSRVFSSTTQKHQFFSAQPSLRSNSHICTWLLEKVYGYLSAKWCLLLFNMLSRFVIAFLPRSKHLLISWLQSPSTVIVEHRIIKSVTASTFSPSIWHEVMGSDATNFIFWMLSFKPTS